MRAKRPRIQRVLLTLVLFAAPLAHAEEECAVDPRLLKPQFAARLPKGFKLISTKKDPKQKNIKQVLKLPDGFQAAVTVSGCSHLLFTIELEGTGLTTKTVGAELVAIARRVLPTLPMDKDSTVDVKLMIQALDEARISVMPAQLPCGDAACSLSVEAAEVKKPAAKAKSKNEKDPPPTAVEPPGVLKLSYDLPL